MNMVMPQGPSTDRTQSQKGAVLVEFALILPVFLLLLFGVITFSIALYNKTVLTIASREGARKGAMYVANRTNTIIKSNATTAATQASNNLITFGDAVTPTISTNTNPLTDGFITVTASYTYAGLYVFSDLALSAQTTMKLE
ncbi:MAG: pilus assembly protein [Chlorobiaceae bacterium]|nr:pilus assembly protein [Chlorobiaceae bacterium]